MKKYIDLNFHLFDEGGDLGAEASAFMDSINGDKKQPEAKPDLSAVQYGRSKGEAEASPVGSDTNDIKAQFAEMTGKGGVFHELYGQSVQEAVQNRFKNQENLQAQVDGMNEALSDLYMNYGLQHGDFEGLKTALANDDSMYVKGAEKAGLDLDQYKQNLKLKAEAEAGRRITEAYEQQQRENEMMAGWEQESIELQQAFPNFDLESEIRSNEQFAKMIYEGVDVKNAFAATHMEELLNGQMQQATRNATQTVVNSIQQRASRPAENGIKHAPAMERRSDPSVLSNDDMDEIFRRAFNGEAFSF